MRVGGSVAEWAVSATGQRAVGQTVPVIEDHARGRVPDRVDAKSAAASSSRTRGREQQRNQVLSV